MIAFETIYLRLQAIEAADARDGIPCRLDTRSLRVMRWLRPRIHKRWEDLRRKWRAAEDARRRMVHLDINSLDPLEAWRDGAADLSRDVEGERARGGDVRYYGRENGL